MRSIISRSVLRRRLSVRTVMASILCLYAFYGLLRGFEPALRDYCKPSDRAVRQGTFRLAEVFRAKRPAHSHAAPPPLNLFFYESSAAPGVFFERNSKYCVSAYLSGGRVVQDMGLADFYVAKPRLPEEIADPPGEGWILLEKDIPMGGGEFSVVYCREDSEQ